LRVATSVGPDVLLLDAGLASRLRGMLRSHPATAGSIILRVSDEGVLPTDYYSAAPNSGRERVRTARATDSVA
jgi:hypothetical protein